MNRTFILFKCTLMLFFFPSLSVLAQYSFEKTDILIREGRSEQVKILYRPDKNFKRQVVKIRVIDKTTTAQKSGYMIQSNNSLDFSVQDKQSFKIDAFKDTSSPMDKFLSLEIVDANGKSLDTLQVQITKPTKVLGSGYTIDNVRGTFGIDVDQDWFLDFVPGLNEDRNYTQGTAFSYSKLNLDKSVLFLPVNLFQKLAWSLTGTDRDNIDKRPSSISLGVTAFTPRVLEDSLNPVIGDRPFSNVVFLQTAYRFFNNKTKFLNTTSFAYGFIGSNIGNTFQSFAHKSIVTGRPTNIGWQHQISDGGRPAFLFSHEGLRKLGKLPDLPQSTIDYLARKHFEVYFGYKVNLGWYNSIAVSSTLRLGRFTKYSGIEGIGTATSSANKFRDDSNDNYLDTEKNDRDITYEYVTPKNRWDWYFFGTLSPRLIPYNSLLLGQPFHKSSYTLPRQNYNPFILDMEVGFFVSKIRIVPDVDLPLSRWDLVLSFNARTSEIISKDPTVENQYKRMHSWGRVSLRIPIFRDTSNQRWTKKDYDAIN
ncbi:hypothetical protein DSL64_21655 [Dyadobacter luteus]|uniref:Uncharacterized protein n=2 Tax=Dyadobacter luteus TaxID=2259619 RepID=A0A3D8Y6B1_9BACT|nr:hypothetical protein DSL64_21655 [Dyadobacter luteus]